MRHPGIIASAANIGAGGGGGGGEEDDDMTLLASGAIAAATPEIQLELPAGYWAFTLRLMGIIASDQNNVTIQFSSDDGETWHEGVADYKTLLNYANTSMDNGPSTVKYFEDNQGYILYDAKPDPTAGVASSATISIDPGSSGTFPQLRSDALDQQSGFFPSITTWVVVCVAERVRQNRIRFQTYIGDEETLEGGAYALYGVPVV